VPSRLQKNKKFNYLTTDVYMDTARTRVQCGRSADRDTSHLKAIFVVFASPITPKVYEW
jgi:hypothetical protein